MKATAFRVIACAAIVFPLPATALAGQDAAISALWISQVSLGQSGEGAGSRRDADELLSRARQAMKEGNWQLAESYVDRAERTGAKFDGLFNRFYDTPAKVRADLAQQRTDKGTAGPVPPSQRAGSPLEGKPTSGAAPMPPSTTPPASAGTTGVQRLEPALSAMTDTTQATAKRYLESARGALARGDKLEAVSWYQKAAGMNVQYAPGDDTPARLADDLRKAGVTPEQLAPPRTAAANPFVLRPNEEGQRTADRVPALGSSFSGQGSNPFGQATTPNPLAGATGGVGAARPGEVPTLPQPSRFSTGQGFGQGPGEPSRFSTDSPLSNAAPMPSNNSTSRFGAPSGGASNEPPPYPSTQPSSFSADRFGGPGRSVFDESAGFASQSISDRSPGGAAQSPMRLPMAGESDPTASPYGVQRSVYDAYRDPSRVRLASGEEPVQTSAGQNALPTPGPIGGPGDAGLSLFQQGEKKLQESDLIGALEVFKEAWKYEAEMDPGTRRKLQTYLTELRLATAAPRRLDVGTALEAVDAQQQVLARQLFSDVNREMGIADNQRATDPKGALERLERMRQQVAQSNLDPAVRQPLLTRVDRAMNELERFIHDNRAQIELDEQNRDVRQQVELGRQVRLETQSKMAQLVEEFNKLMDEQRFAEAEALAQKARELNPLDPVVQVITWKSNFARRIISQTAIAAQKEDGVVRALQDVDLASVPFDTSHSIEYPDVNYWSQISRARSKLKEQGQRLSAAELHIQEALKKPVEVRFTQRPLGEVMQLLAQMADVNLHLDPQGMAAEAITSDTPVTINLTQPISLASALNHILHPLRLSYVIQDEVLKITSEQTRERNVFTRVYNVADLVIPIPNFIPSYNMGLPGAIREAHNTMGYGILGGQLNNAPLTVMANNNQPQAGAGGSVLAQMGSMGMLNGRARAPQMTGFGPGGLGGGAQADFDSLIELITSTIKPSSWDETGGPGSIKGFDTNLSLVVSQTQEVHEEIVDLLEQLRRLQDLQVTIEVRFITLTDDFFERVGVDFDFDIDDNVAALPPDDQGPSVTIGLDPMGMPTADFDLQFSQSSFSTAVPAFGGFDATTAANFGFAILSDIEAFFLIQAAQGDTRTNVMQAPKVTLFNGQQAYVSDTTQRPFVTSVIPVVGDFAAAHQPVIVVLSEGTSLSVQAVVSSDRRFIRLTVVPFFSRIGDVETFTFNGRTTTSSGTAAQDPTDDTKTVQNDAQTVMEGTTVQLPTFSFVTVTTTVSVPDGGTVLLGGIKRMSEGRTERGIPIFSKLPYINRLFRNVGIGRNTRTLMMMVTPRIIIQEEEEERQTGYVSS